MRRSTLYKYASPGERLLVSVGRFLVGAYTTYGLLWLAAQLRGTSGFNLSGSRIKLPYGRFKERNIGPWILDATVPSMPNRRRGVQALLETIDGAGAPQPRARVLERWGQHTTICPDSQAVGRCRLTPGCPQVDRAWFQRLKLGGAG